MVVLYLLALLQSPSRELSLEDVARTRSVQDIRAAPDGKSAVVQIGSVDTVADGHTADLWSVDLDSRILRRPTNHPAAEYGARFASDGRTLGPLTSRRGRAEVFGLPLEGGDARPIFVFPGDVAEFSSCPRSDCVVFTAEDTSASNTPRARGRVRFDAHRR